jgi:hypothetical protein
MKRLQRPPFTVKLELVEGCCMYHKFCGIQAIRKSVGNYKFMDLTHLKHIVALLSVWDPIRVEMAMHGEPTRHPDFLAALQIIRKALPNSTLMVTSNGGGVRNKQDLFNVVMDYVNVFMFSLYGDNKPQYVQDLRTLADNSDCPVFEFPNVEKKSPYGKGDPTKHTVWFAEPLDKVVGPRTHRITNHGGCGGPLDFKQRQSSCARPFREMAIRYDGRAILCCQDWLGAYPTGNLLTANHIEDVWQSDASAAARSVLLSHKRMLPPCYGCGSITFRHGLLPNQGAKGFPKKLKPATDTDISIWKRVVKSGPLTPDVRKSVKATSINGYL